MATKEDVGMAIKMNAKCFADIEKLDRGEPIDESQIIDLITFVNERHDCADFRLICLIKTYLGYKESLSKQTIYALERMMLDFKYWMDEPGIDGMCYWSENHQLLFAACEYLAGQSFPNHKFFNNKETGTMHQHKAKIKILRWLDQRFKYGFIEWHSNTYYEEDIAPLCVLIDHATDEEIVKKAKIILDILFLDLALYSFEGYFTATSGRCYEQQKKDGINADVNDILAYAFGILHKEYDFTRISAMFLLCKNYEVPNIIKKIARIKEPMVLLDSMGLDLKEVKPEFPNAAFDERGMFLWAMEAFTNVESIEMTMDLFNAWNLKENNFLQDLKMINIPILRKLRLLPLVVRILNPATQGVAIQRENSYTLKTKNYMLSTAQNYHPGEFGDQQHIWQATLPGRVNVFSTHPGSPMFDDSARNFSPSYWVGNGINPHAVQDKNVLLLMYDLSRRKGFLERKRQPFIHFYFPISKFDEVIRQEKTIFGKKNDTYIAIVSSVPYEIIKDEELVYHGKISHFAVILGDKTEYRDFEKFIDQVSASSLKTSGKKMTYQTDKTYQLRYKGDFVIDDLIISTNYPRFDTPFVKAKRKPEELVITYEQQEYWLGFQQMIRNETRKDESDVG